jgi:glucose/arabinose dehydrogenase/PKD repeat protein
VFRRSRGPSRGLAAACALAAAFAVGSPPSGAATLPQGFAETAFGPITGATAIALAPDGRIFVSEKTGNVRVIKNGVLLSAPFANLDPAATDERGVMGFAFDPDFATNRYVYVYYTAKTPTVHNRVSRLTADGDVAVPGSELVLLDIPTSSSGIHNAGAIHFGSDGKLYIAVGDDSNGANSQSLATLRGKLLRINPDGSIPTDNPFYGTSTGDNRAIWAVGLRNPFTFAVERGSGRILINDVGDKAWEEIDEGARGENYGWPRAEGASSDPALRGPVFAYGHGTSGTTGCAITGGDFYDAPAKTFPSLYHGDYFFADYCSGWIRTFDPVTKEVRPFASGISKPVDVDVAPDGSLWYLSKGPSGHVYRVRSTDSLAPVIVLHPESQTVTRGRPASFSVSASGAEPLAYQWRRNDVDIPGATSTTYTIPSVTDADNAAQFRCVVSNSFGFAVSDPATLTVTDNRPPVASISAPVAGTKYEAGQTITYTGGATDPEDGTLPPSAFTWQIDLYHDDGALHSHPVLPPTSGSKTATFTVPRIGETSPNVWYRFTLTVTDAEGLTHTVERDIVPRTATMTIASAPAGLEIELDATPRQAPFSVVGVVGMTRALGAGTPQTLGADTYDFVSWSDGGAREHEISAPSTDTTFTAAFAAQGSTATHTFAPVEDAFVRSNYPSERAGLEPTVRVYRSGSTETHTYLRFAVAGLSGPVASATLRLHVASASAVGGSVYAVADTGWQEETITWTSKPPMTASGRPIGATSVGAWVEVDVTSLVAGNGLVGFGIKDGSSTKSWFSSREGAQAPQLVVTAGGGGGGSMPAAAFSASPVSGNAPLEVAFADASTGAPAGWEWDFTNDGTVDATVSSPTFTYAAPGSYTVRLRVENGAGSDEEVKTDYISVGAAPGSSPVTFTPVEDAFVRSNYPGERAGLQPTLRVYRSGSTETHSYLRFELAGLSGPVASARLRLFVVAGGAVGGSVFGVADTAWQEETITWPARPPMAGVGRAIGPTSAGGWVEVDVTGLVAGNGPVGFGIKEGAAKSWYSSKEGTQPPQLVVTQASFAFSGLARLLAVGASAGAPFRP